MKARSKARRSYTTPLRKLVKISLLFTQLNEQALEIKWLYRAVALGYLCRRSRFFVAPLKRSYIPSLLFFTDTHSFGFQSHRSSGTLSRRPPDVGDLRCPRKKDDERMRSEPLMQQAFFS